jgi:hypothetical protein
MLVQHQPGVGSDDVSTSMWAHEDVAGVQRLLGCVAMSVQQDSRKPAAGNVTSSSLRHGGRRQCHKGPSQRMHCSRKETRPVPHSKRMATLLFCAFLLAPYCQAFFLEFHVLIARHEIVVWRRPPFARLAVRSS